MAFFFAGFLSFLSCWGSDKSGAEQEGKVDSTQVKASDNNKADVPLKPLKVEKKGPKGTITKTYMVAKADESVIKKEATNKANCIFFISKHDYRLYVCEKIGGKLNILAHFPVCYAKNRGPKTRTGDFCTPECSMEHPAKICQIQDASGWMHDFKDGRGSIPSYGPYFMRLDLSQSDCHQGCRSNRSIGIHGCTSNEESVPGQDSEGCIRLRDKDLSTLRTKYAQVGTKVVILGYEKGPFEPAKY